DARSDVYSLGLTLYEVLTLHPAFTADNHAQLLEKVLQHAPPSPRSLDPSIPRDLETVILKAMARDPAARYATAQELADDLRRFLEGRAVRARRAGVGERVWRWARRNPTLALLSSALALAMLTGTVVSLLLAGWALGEADLARTNGDLASDK